jgi:lipopolysaccharide/colanic/teichoic acid biosynthesis glycosyltransferase
MTQTLPTIRLKIKELILLNVPCMAETLYSPFADYKVRPLNNVQSNVCFTQMLTISRAEEVPYAIVADYKLLAFNDFAFVRAFRKNALTVNVPIVAVADEDDVIDFKGVMGSGIDDCYRMPVDFDAVKERIEFLHKNKATLSSVDLTHTDVLKVKISPFKRVIDVLGASTVLLCASPFLLLTAALIKLESGGPIIYKSKRSGTGYQVFDFLKFRSMYADADSRLKEIEHLNQYADNGDGTTPTFMKVKNDPRITRIGRFIRKTSIDELPQLINVLRGDMSLVGNRPLPLYEAEQLTKEDWAYRFLAPAGLTGLWQVSKRGGDDMSAEERIALDVTYARKNSFWFDLKLLLKTPFSMIQKENV